MSYVFNPFTGTLDWKQDDVQVLSSAPLNPYQGQEYINSADHKLYIYYGTTWQVLHQLESLSPVTGNPIGLLLSLTYTI